MRGGRGRRRGGARWRCGCCALVVLRRGYRLHRPSRRGRPRRQRGWTEREGEERGGGVESPRAVDARALALRRRARSRSVLGGQCRETKEGERRARRAAADSPASEANERGVRACVRPQETGQEARSVAAHTRRSYLDVNASATSSASATAWSASPAKSSACSERPRQRRAASEQSARETRATHG